jgi:hypothetical protein
MQLWGERAAVGGACGASGGGGRGGGGSRETGSAGHIRIHIIDGQMMREGDSRGEEAVTFLRSIFQFLDLCLGFVVTGFDLMTARPSRPTPQHEVR